MSDASVGETRTLAELASQAEEIVRYVQRSGSPITVTTEGQGDVVIVDAKQFHRYLRTAKLATLLAEGEADVRTGRMRPIEEFWGEFESDQKIPR